jgi:hypothetical protein
LNYAVTQQKRIFGTDGVRGVANVEPVTAETALKLGRAAAYVFAQLNPRRTPNSASKNQPNEGGQNTGRSHGCEREQAGLNQSREYSLAPGL